MAFAKNSEIRRSEDPNWHESAAIFICIRSSAIARRIGSFGGSIFPTATPIRWSFTPLRQGRRDGLCHDHRPRHDRGLSRAYFILQIHLSASRLRLIFRRIHARLTCSSGAFPRGSTPKFRACATIFSTCRLSCKRESIAHAVAHPLYSINGKLSTSHLERLILLFQHFEGINGLRDALLSDLTRHILAQLTPAKNRRVRQPPQPRTDPSRAVEKDPHRRLRRSRRDVCRNGLHGNAGRVHA